MMIFCLHGVDTESGGGLDGTTGMTGRLPRPRKTSALSILAGGDGFLTC